MPDAVAAKIIPTVSECIKLTLHETNNLIITLCFNKSQRSAIEHEVIIIDNDTKDMLEAINFKDLPGIQVQAVSAQRS